MVVLRPGTARVPFRVTSMAYRVTPEQLEFRARFGLGRFMGPWHVERAQVSKVFMARGLMSDCIAIRGSHYLDWTIYTFHPEPILLALEELGYPVDWLASN